MLSNVNFCIWQRFLPSSLFQDLPTPLGQNALLFMNSFAFLCWWYAALCSCLWRMIHRYTFKMVFKLMDIKSYPTLFFLLKMTNIFKVYMLNIDVKFCLILNFVVMVRLKKICFLDFLVLKTILFKCYW